METRSTPQENKEHFAFLDTLRESCITNMFGAAPFLQDEFPELDKSEARVILAMWMEDFKN
mgnify:FL=1